jgi:hypothetical protein
VIFLVILSSHNHDITTSKYYIWAFHFFRVFQNFVWEVVPVLDNWPSFKMGANGSRSQQQEAPLSPKKGGASIGSIFQDEQLVVELIKESEAPFQVPPQLRKLGTYALLTLRELLLFANRPMKETAQLQLSLRFVHGMSS